MPTTGTLTPAADEWLLVYSGLNFRSSKDRIITAFAVIELIEQDVEKYAR